MGPGAAPTTRGLAPGVSVVLRTYNGVGSIGRTLTSLAEQTLDPALFEIVVVPNGPDDGTVDLVRRVRADHPDLTIRVVRCPATGVGPSSNVGFEASRREYLTLVDDDDAVSPSYLAALLEPATPRTIVHGYLADVDPDGGFPDFDTYMNRSVSRAAGRTVHPGQVPSALSFNTAKLVSTRLARAVRARENLRFGTDVVFWNTIADRFSLDVTVLPASAHAVYYRNRRVGSYSRPAEVPRQEGISARLDTITALWPIAHEPGRFGRRTAAHAIRAQARGIGTWLHAHPDDHSAAVEEIVERGLEPFPWDAMNRGRARDLAACYAFLPSNNTGAIVGGRRVRARGLCVDVVSTDMRRYFDLDMAAAQAIVEPYVGNRFEHTGYAGVTWGPISSYARAGIERIEAWQAEQGPYRSVYSRAMQAASHVLAALHKVRSPDCHWIAEFSDPLSSTVGGKPRAAKRKIDPLSAELDSAIRAAGFEPPEGLFLMQWIEHLAYVLADEIQFTNANQREYMVSRIPDERLRERVMERSVVSAHPTPPPDLYRRGTTRLRRVPGRLHLAYFGAFYPTRGLTEVVDAVRSLPKEQRDRLVFHVYTKDPGDLATQLRKHRLADVIVPHPYGHDLDFLHLTTQFDCLIVNDARTADTHPLNPYLPSKLSDYRGSGTPIWAVVEPGSILSRQDVEHRSELGDVDGAREVLQTLLTTAAAAQAVR